MMQSTEAMDHCWCFSHITLRIVALVFLLPFCNWCFSRQSIALKSGWLNLIPSNVIWNKCVENEATFIGFSEGRSLLYNTVKIMWDEINLFKINFKKLHPLKYPWGTYTPENCLSRTEQCSILTLSFCDRQLLITAPG